MDTQDIGKALMDARMKMGLSRNALAQSKALQGKITGEGIRKIEYGERIPKFPTLKLLADTLGIKDAGLKALEKTALEKQVARIARKTTHGKVTFKVSGKPMKVLFNAPEKKMEAQVRTAVEKLLEETVAKYGVMDEDLAHFRRHARSVLVKQLAV